MSISQPSTESNSLPDLTSLKKRVDGLSFSFMIGELLLDQRQRHEAGGLIPVENYVDAIPALGGGDSLIIDLIYNEFLLRSEIETPSQDDFLKRFPEWSDSLEKQFQVYNAMDGTEFGHDSSLSQTAFETRSDGVRNVASVADCAQFQQHLDHDRFELEEKVGKGTFAVVFKAWDATLRRWVAIKFSKTLFDGRSIEQDRFVREAELAAGMAHPGVVRVYEFGNRDKRPYIVQEFVGGGTLKARIFDGNYSHKQAANWVSKIGDAIEYAHQLGIVHRDIKPANILFDDRGEPKVADFGLAGLADQESQLTRNGDLLGTPAYMSPEQAMGNPVGPSSDIYSLGIVLFELIFGRPPFLGPATSVIEQVAKKLPQPPRELKRKVPKDLQIICFKAISKSPADRYRSAQEFSQDLRRFSDGLPILSKPTGVVEKTVRWCFRQPAFALTILFALLAIMIVAATSMVRINFERNRFREQRDIANASLFKSLVKSAETRLHSKQTDWYDKTISDIRDAASLAIAKTNKKPLQELLLETLSDTSYQLRAVRTWHELNEPVTAIDSHEELTVVGFDSGSIRLLDFDQSSRSISLVGPTLPIRQLHLTGKNDSVIALAGDEVWRWNIAEFDVSNSAAGGSVNGEVIQRNVKGCSLSRLPSANRMAIVMDTGTVDVLDLDLNKSIATWQTAPCKLTCLEISKNGTMLAMGKKNRSLKVWDIETHEPIVELTIEDPALSCAFSSENPDNPTIVWTTRVSYSTESLENGSRSRSSIRPGAIRQIKSFYLPNQTNSLMVVGMDEGSLQVCTSRHGVIAQTKFAKGLSCLAVNHRFEEILVGDDSGNVSMSTMSGGKFARRITSIHDLAFTPDSKIVVDSQKLSFDPTLKPEPLDNVEITAMHAGQRLEVLAGTRQGDLYIRKRGVQEFVTKFSAHESDIVAIESGKSENWFATADRLGHVKIWRSADLECIQEFQFEPYNSMQIACHPGHDLVFANGRNGIQWSEVDLESRDFEEMKNTIEVSKQPDPVAPVDLVDCCSTHLVVSSGTNISVFDLDDLNQPVASVSASSDVRQIEFSQDGEAIIWITDDSIECWYVDPWERSFAQEIDTPYLQFASDPQNRFIATNQRNSNEFQILNFENGRPIAGIFGLIPLSDFSFSHDAKSLLLGARGILLQNVEEIEAAIENGDDTYFEIGRPNEHVLPGGAWNAIWSTSVSPDNSWIATTCHNRHVTIRDSKSLRIIKHIGGFESEVWCSAISSDSKFLAVGSELDDGTGKVSIFNSNDWSLKRTLNLSTRLIADVAFHPQAPWLAVSSFDGSVCIVNYESGELLNQLVEGEPKNRQLSSASMNVSFSSDGKWLAAAKMTKGIFVWNLEQQDKNWKQPFVLVSNEPTVVQPANQRIWAIAFDCHGQRLACASESGQVDIFQVGSFEHLVALRTGSTRLRAIEFSPDNRYLGVSAFSAQGIVWDMDKLEEKLVSMGLGFSKTGIGANEKKPLK